MRKLPKGEKPADTTDFKLIRTKKFTPAQHNDACNSCHSKAMPLTAGYKTPERFFDHFDLVTLENRTSTRTAATWGRTTPRPPGA